MPFNYISIMTCSKKSYTRAADVNKKGNGISRKEQDLMNAHKKSVYPNICHQNMAASSLSSYYFVSPCLCLYGAPSKAEAELECVDVVGLIESLG